MAYQRSSNVSMSNHGHDVAKFAGVQHRFTWRLLQQSCLILVFLALVSQLAYGSDWVFEDLYSNGQLGWRIDIECQDPNQVHLLYDMQSSNHVHADGYAGNWAYTYSFADFTKFDLALDSAGMSRLLTTEYNGSEHVLYYRQETSPGTWYGTSVASGVNSGNAKLGIDQQDNSYLAFVDQSTLTLKCAKIVGDLNSGWNIDVDPVVTDPVFNVVNERICLAMDNAGNPNILWHNFTNNSFKRAFQPTPGGSWQVDTIYSGIMGDDYSAAFDSNGNLHVAYRDYTSVKHAIYDGTQWSDEQVFPTGDRVGALAIDSSDQVHIGYIDFDYAADKDVIRYATLLGDEWHDEAVMDMPSSSSGLEELDMTMDSQRHIHMAFRGDAHDLHYARLDEPPKYQITEEESFSVSVDAEADLQSGVGFVVSDGSWRITAFKYDYSGIDWRGILEFNLDALTPNEEVVAARLDLFISLISGTPTSNVYAYEGDGSIDASDAGKTSHLVGTSEAIQDLGPHSIDLDPDVLIAQLGDTSWLGLLIVGINSQTGFDALENYLSTPATLVLEVVSHLYGDANRDGRVDDIDAGILADNWLSSSGVSWGEGDFNVSARVRHVPKACG